MREVFLRPIPRLGAGWLASSDGRIFSPAREMLCGGTARADALPKTRVAPAREVAQRWSSGQPPYLVVTLLLNGKRRDHFVHRLVCEAFHGPRPEGALCRHLDDERRNNHEDNLAWGTSRDNTDDATRNGRVLRGEAHGRCRLPDAAVAEIRATYRPEIKRDLAERFGVSPGHVYAVWRGYCRRG